MYDHDALRDLIREQALRFGDFTLASGKKASFYLDCRKVTLHAQGVNWIAAGMIDVWRRQGIWPDAVGGMAVGAVPIAAAILTRVANDPSAELRGFFCRKELKGHGTGQLVEGPVSSGDRVIIVEDVVSTGGSSLQAVNKCREFGLDVIGVTAIIDRLIGGREKFAEHGLPLTSLFTIGDFGIKPE